MSRFFAAALLAVLVAPVAAWAEDCVPMDDVAEGTWANYYNTAECVSFGPGAASDCTATAALPSNDQCGLYPNNRTYAWTSGLTLEESDGSGPKRYVRYGQVRRVDNNGFCGNFFVKVVRTSTAPAYCTADPDIECSTLANVNTLGSATNQPDSFTPGDEICVKTSKVGGATKTLGGAGNQNGCAAFKRATQTFKRLGTTNDREWMVQYQFTGLECDAQPEQTETPEPTHDGEVCKTGAGGLTWCENPEDTTGKDCGFFNDKYVCLDSLGTDKCFTKADGSRICAANAPTPPVPDNGTPGVKATPNDTMQVCTGENACQSINYYNSTTAGGSSRDPGDGAQADGSGTVGAGGATIGNGNGTDPEGEDSGVTGGATCTAEPVCTGDAVQCAQLMQTWRARCPEGVTEAEALSAVGATDAEKGLEAGPNDAEVTIDEIDSTGFIVGGSCPNAGSFTVMGQTISMENLWQPACDMAVLFAPIVQAMGFLFAALLLVRTNWG